MSMVFVKGNPQYQLEVDIRVTALDDHGRPYAMGQALSIKDCIPLHSVSNFRSLAEVLTAMHEAMEKLAKEEPAKDPKTDAESSL